jgi:hypothetical protein
MDRAVPRLTLAGCMWRHHVERDRRLSAVDVVLLEKRLRWPSARVASSRSPTSPMYVASTPQCSGHSWSCHGSNRSPPG